MSKFVTYPAVTVLDNDHSLLIDDPNAGTNSITAENAGNTLLSKWAGFETFDEAVQNTIEHNQEFIDRDTAIREETAELKKKIVTTFPAKDASGAVATFESEFEDAPLKSCIVQIEPVQDLHGYDHPWPAGGNVNQITVNRTEGLLDGYDPNTKRVFEYDKYYVGLSYNNYYLKSTIAEYSVGDNIVSLKTDRNSYGIAFPVAVTPSTEYFAGATYNGTSRIGASFFDADGSLITYTTLVAGASQVVKTPDGCVTCVLVVYDNRASSQSVRVTDVFFNSPSSETSYSPYSNICPITGWTGCELQRTGKNLLNADTYYGDYKQSDGSYLLSASNLSIILIPLKTFIGKTVTFSAEVTIRETTTNLRARAFINGRATNGTPATTNATSTISVTATPVTDDDYIHITYGSGGSNPVTLRNVQLEEGSAVTTYESFGQTYPIAFPTEAGTVYGGYVDVTGGELVVDRAMVDLPSDMSCDTWGVNYKTSGITGFYIYRHNTPSTLDFSNIRKAVLTNLLPINQFVWGGSEVGYGSNTNAVEPSNWYEMVSICNESANILSTDTKAEAVAKFKTFLASTPLNVLYELAEPIHYPLTPTEIKTLLGQNNIWSNTGDTAVEYLMSDVSWYVEKKLRAFQSILAGVEDSTSASKNYSANTYLIFNNDIYRVTKAITAGETIEEGVNVTKTTVAEQLMALAQA